MSARATRATRTRRATPKPAPAADTAARTPAAVADSPTSSHKPKSSPTPYIASYAPGMDPSGAITRRGGFMCGGCRGNPSPDCACCGAAAVVAIADPGEKHAVTYCRACLRVLLAARAECRREKQINAARIAAKTHAETSSSASPARPSPASSSASTSPRTTDTPITRHAGRAYPDVVQPALPLFAAMEVA